MNTDSLRDPAGRRCAPSSPASITRLPSSALALALLAGLVAPACAEDEGDPTAFSATIENGPKGGVFRVTGKTLPLPNNTRLVVTLAAKGKAKDITCSLFRVPVQGSAYQGGQEWEGRLLAPLVYEAKVELVVAKQAPAVKKWVMREYGYTSEHKEVLGTQELSIGTPAEQVAFARKNLKRIRGQVVRLDELRAEAHTLVSTPAAEQPDYAEKKQAFDERTIEYRRELDRYRLGYVALLETGYFTRMIKALEGASRYVRDHGKGKRNKLKQVTKLSGHIRSILESIDARLPREPADESGPESRPAPGSGGEGGQ